MQRAQKSGTTEHATKYDATSDSTTASASAEKRNRLTPYRNVTGKKTTELVSVAASTAVDTSAPPFSAATSGGSPISRWRKMFSSTMTALSISRENTSASPARIIVLIELPPKYSRMKAARAESGIDRNTAAVARRLP